MESNAPDLNPLEPKKTLRSDSPAVVESEDARSRRNITIGKPVDQIYAFCRELRNLPLVMKELDEEWTAEIVREIPNEEISWRGLEGGRMAIQGTLWFEPATAGRGTVVSLALDYSLPGGKAGEMVSKLLGHSPDLLAQINLRRLKAWLETGEVPTTDGQPSGRSTDEAPMKNLH